MHLTDTHCHLDFPDFSDDLDELLTRAHEAGVHRLISIGTSTDSSASALEIAHRFPQVKTAAGIHPCNAESADDSSISALIPLLEDPCAVAIGECGLDYHYLPDRPADATDQEYAEQIEAWKAHQKKIFTAQLDLAVRFGFNVVIHQRDSWDDVMECLRPYGENGGNGENGKDGEKGGNRKKLKAVFHCFGENKERAIEAVEAGHFLSFTGIISFKNAHQARESASVVPEDRIMIETDAPYLAPHPHRGKRNESSYLPLIAQTLAEVRGLSVEEAAHLTETNTDHFFARQV